MLALWIKITDDMIADEVYNTSTLYKGLQYYRGNKVDDIYFDEEEMSIYTTVKGKRKYDVQVTFFHGEIDEYTCECPAYTSYHGACKHIVATLKKAQQMFKNGQSINFLDKKKYDYEHVNRSIFNYFEKFEEEKNREEVKLEVIYELGGAYSGYTSSVELKIGKDRLYVVKNMYHFLGSLEKNEIIEFGKKFTFDPQKHTFSDIDQEIIDLLSEIYQNENIVEYSFHYREKRAFKGKKVYLSQIGTKRLFSTLRNKSFTGRFLDREITNMNVLNENIPVEFSLVKDKSDMILQLNLETGMIPLTKKGEYFLYKENVYKPDEKQREYFLPFYNAHMKTGKGLIISDKERFASEILPYVKKVAEISIDPSIEKSFLQEELKAAIYFDKYDDGISAKIDFCYGEEIINPFKEQNKSLDKEKILIRDKEKERGVLSTFENDEFIVSKEKAILKDEERIFDFIHEDLPKLHKLAEVYYSEDFKRMKLKDPSAFSVGIRLDQGNSMLEFSFEHEDIDSEELSDIFTAFKEKKKYFRLKDGSFIPLDDTKVEKIADIIEFLDISRTDLENKVIQLPKYRALYLDKQLREAELDKVERNQIFKRLVQNIKEPKDMEYDVPKELEAILRDYQKIGFKWLKTLSDYEMGGILADDMGLGKTLQVIAFILSEKEKGLKPSLVVAPTSLVYNWENEIKKFTSDLHVVIVSGAPKERQEQIQKIEDADVVVTSYPLIRRDIENYEKMKFAYCFLDEAQHIKNPNSLNAKSVKQIHAKGYFALTGTPIENSLTELWSIFDFVMPKFLLSHGKFTKKYEKPIVKDKDTKALSVLSNQINPFILRRLKKEVLKELPDKIETKMVTELTKDQKKVYLAYLKEAKGEISKEISENGFNKSKMKILALLMRLRQICCHPSLFLENYKGDSAKFLMLQEIIKDAIGSGHRILLFSQFTNMLGIIREWLSKEKIGYFYLDGSVKAEKRQTMVESFESGENSLFLISLKAGGTGLNLTSADMVIHFDPWWNPAVEEQATDRAYRIGQKNTVQVMKLITKGTIEEKIYELQQKKKEMIESVIKPGETMISKMSEEEIRGLFED